MDLSGKHNQVLKKILMITQCYSRNLIIEKKDVKQFII